MVARSQTVEDGPPRDDVESDRFDEHTGNDRASEVIVIRHPRSGAVTAVRLVVRAYKFDGTITAACALETIRVER